MKELIENIKKNLTERNSNIIENLINIIIDNSLNSIESLINLENTIFTIKGKKLSREEKVNYCYNNIINSYYDADSLDFEESLEYYKYYELLKTSINIEDKIKYIILLYDLTGRKQLLVYEIYNCIINNQI